MFFFPFFVLFNYTNEPFNNVLITRIGQLTVFDTLLKLVISFIELK